MSRLVSSCWSRSSLSDLGEIIHVVADKQSTAGSQEEKGGRIFGETKEMKKQEGGRPASLYSSIKRDMRNS